MTSSSLPPVQPTPQNLKAFHPQGSPWSLSLGRVGGIPIRVHMSFFLLLLWIGLMEAEQGGKPLVEVLFVLSIFGCVVLHELGHALMARWYSVRTRDIVLYPFGGIATILDQPTAKAEFFIAVAGPLVNVALAGIAFPFVSWSRLLQADFLAPDIMFRFFITNLFLAAFNMIPALPMDGGRVLRSVLTLLGVKSATVICARVSQVISFVGGAFALYTNNVVLIMIAALIFFSATQEIVAERTRRASRAYQVRDVMTDRESLQCLTHGMTVSDSMRVALKSYQNMFPVMLGDELLGLVEKQSLFQLAATEPENQFIGQVLLRDLPVVAPETGLPQALYALEAAQGLPLIVRAGERFVGILTKDKLLEFLLLHELRDQAVRHAATNDL